MGGRDNLSAHWRKALERLNRIDPDGALSRRWVRAFLNDSPGRLENLRTAVEIGFLPAVVNAAYSLKIMAGWLGGHRLSVICGNLEQAGRARDQDECRIHLSVLEEHLPVFEASLRVFLVTGTWTACPRAPGGCLRRSGRSPG